MRRPAIPVVSPNSNVSTSVSPQMRVRNAVPAAGEASPKALQPVSETTQLAVIVPRSSIVVPKCSSPSVQSP